MHVKVNFARDPEETFELWDAAGALAFLERAVIITGLHAITQTVVVEHEEGAFLHIDGHVIIAESHIHVTLLPEIGLGFADVFSCMDVEPGKVAGLIDELFGGHQDTEISARGLPQKGDL